MTFHPHTVKIVQVTANTISDKEKSFLFIVQL